MSKLRLSDENRRTLAYYNEHASDFVSNTLPLDMSELYRPFLEGIPHAGRILDAGCGSGRDSLAFLRMGFDVVSIDASTAMVGATTELTGRTALLMSFSEMMFENEFDGIWACASLLHVSREDLPSCFARFERALKQSGIFYLSFKYGDSERMDNARFFNDLNESLLHEFMEGEPDLQPLRIWTTEDVRHRNGQKWLNALARKKA